MINRKNKLPHELAIKLHEDGKDAWNDYMKNHPNTFIDFQRHSFKKCNFRGYIFNSHANFRLANFAENADFREAHFSGDTNFREIIFNGKSDFSNALFSGYAYFDKTSFNRDAIFKKTVFKGITNYKGVKFNRSVNFDNADFYEKLSFTKEAVFIAFASFKKTIFREESDFNLASFNGCSFEKATFEKSTNFSQTTFHENVGFNGATFNGDVVFIGSIFKRQAIFLAAKFMKGAFASGAKFEIVPDFRQASIPANIIDGISVNYLVKGSAFSKLIGKASGPEDASRYRLLKRHAIDAKDHEQEQRFFSLEMKAKRFHDEKNIFHIMLNFLYEWFSGYGTSISRPFFALIALWLSSGAVYTYLSVTKSYLNSFMYSLTNMMPFGSLGKSSKFFHEALFKKGLPWEGDNYLLFYTTLTANSLLGFLLIFFIGLAFRNRFRL